MPASSASMSCSLSALICSRKTVMRFSEIFVIRSDLFEPLVPVGHNRTKCSAANTCLFDHLVGAGEQRLRNFQAERLGGFKIDRQSVFCRLLNGQIGDLLALEDAIDVA